jgi:hypothetical protein
MRILMVGLDNAGQRSPALPAAVLYYHCTVLYCTVVTQRAGKTTVVRKFNGESIDEICPTLGFNIKTMDFQARALLLLLMLLLLLLLLRVARFEFHKRAGLQAEPVGRWRAEEPAHVLAQLLRANGCAGSCRVLKRARQGCEGGSR